MPIMRSHASLVSRVGGVALEHSQAFFPALTPRPLLLCIRSPHTTYRL